MKDCCRMDSFKQKTLAEWKEALYGDSAVATEVHFLSTMTNLINQ